MNKARAPVSGVVTVKMKENVSHGKGKEQERHQRRKHIESLNQPNSSGAEWWSSTRERAILGSPN